MTVAMTGLKTLAIHKVRWQHKRLRRPRELVVDRPGALVQMDSKHVALRNGEVVYQFGAAAHQSSWRRVLEAGGDPVPFQIQAIQSDWGSEFL